MDSVLWATTLSDTKIGKFQNVITGTPDTPLIDILRLFITKSISAIPILDSEGNQYLTQELALIYMKNMIS